MVGFLGAIAGGAMKGWSAGTLSEIKAKREEKLKLLDQQFLHSENELTRGVQREELAARERQSAAQLASQERLTLSGQGIQKSIAEMQVANQRAIAELGEAGATGRAKLTIAANQKLADVAAEAAQKLNTSLVPYQDPDNPEKTIYRLTRKDGTIVKNPIDAETGKELTFVPTTEDSNEMKTIKGLMLLGVPQQEATDKVMNAKTFSREQAEVGILKSITDGMTTFKNLDAEDLDFAKKEARKITDGIYGPAETPAEPAAGDPNAVAPAVPSSSGEADVVIPKGATNEQVAAWVTQALAAKADRAALTKAVRKAGYDPAKVGL